MVPVKYDFLKYVVNTVVTTSRDYSQAHLYEYHILTDRLHRTLSCIAIPYEKCYSTLIPNTSLMAFYLMYETALAVFDLKTSTELARIATEFAVEQTLCGRNTLALVGYNNSGRKVALYSRNGSELKRLGVVELKNWTYPVLSASGVLAYLPKDNDMKINLIDCVSMATNEGAESSRNGAESSGNAAEPSRNGEELSGNGAESPRNQSESSRNGAESSRDDGEPELKKKRIDNIQDSAEPTPKSIDIDEKEVPMGMSEDGDLLGTIRRYDIKRMALAVYSTRTRQQLSKLDISFFRLSEPEICFCASRFLIVTDAAEPKYAIDLYLHRYIPILNARDIHIVRIRKYRGDYYFNRFNFDDTFHLEKLDLSSPSWRSLE